MRSMFYKDRRWDKFKRRKGEHDTNTTELFGSYILSVLLISTFIQTHLKKQNKEHEI